MTESKATQTNETKSTQTNPFPLDELRNPSSKITPSITNSNPPVQKTAPDIDASL